MRNKRILLLLPLAIALGAFGVLSPACGGSSGSSSSGNPDCFDYTSFDGMSPPVTFKADVLPIFRTSCGLSQVCHGNRTPATPAQHFYGPPLSEGATVSNADIALIRMGAVGVPSVDEPDMNIITPSDPSKSFMMYKLDADPLSANTSVTCSTLKCAANMACGTGMPQAGMQLSSTDRDTVRRWIAQGAQDN
jgi:hypothetical protein